MRQPSTSAKLRDSKAGRGLERYLDIFSPLTGGNDLMLAGVICIALAVFFVPLPPLLLDFGLALSIAISILVLMVAVWVKKPLEFNSFPTLLLIVTVLRLALSVASTRLILMNGQNGTDAAGNVIQGVAFFVVGGDFLVGAIIFAILVIINFIVITKGSTRIAEVAARFSLDAMAGKQMAVDADLNAGAIDDAEAKRRRKEIDGESSFFGAMDGASKFVRGDAVAGLIIAGVNIVGGLLIGMLRHDMAVGDAVETYTILTIGDGLVAQIPALIVSIAAGLIVTKGGTEGSSSEALVGQMGSNPKALYVTAALILGVGLLPGFPFLIFTLLSGVIMTFALLGRRSQQNLAAQAEMERKRQAAKPADAESPADLMKIDTIRLDLGSGLVMMIDDVDAALPGKVKSLRNLFAQDFGFVLPTVRIKDNATLSAGGYKVSIQGVTVAEGEIVLGSRLLIDPADQVKGIPGTRVKEPTFGLSALWIDASRAAEAEAQGHTVVDAESVIITHLTEVIKEHMPDLLTYGATQELLKSMSKDYQKLITDISNPSPVILLQQVLQRLLSERVSIRNIELVAEAMSEAGAILKSPVAITEHVRRKLSAQICKSIEDATGHLPVITLGRSWSDEFRDKVKVDGEEVTSVMSPQRVQEFVLAARVEIQKYAARDEWPALLVNPEFRPTIRSMLERVSPMTPVISHGEIHRRTKLKPVSTIGA